MVLFDLPTETKKQRSASQQFRKALISDGFHMFQFSVYVRHCMGVSHAKVHAKRVKALLPDDGVVAILTITDKQFGEIDIFRSKKKEKIDPNVSQLELF